MQLPLVIRASNTDRVFTCHGSLLVADLIPQAARDDGDEGTLLHHQIAEKAIATLGAFPPEGGLQPPNVREGYKLPAFSAWITDWAIERVRELVPSDWSLMVEVPLAYEYQLPRPVWIPVSELTGYAENQVTDGKVRVDQVALSGHMDIFAISPDGKQAIGIDWKTGLVGADPAESNWQALTYIGLAKRAWPELTSIKFVLAQPRIDEESTGIPRVSDTLLDGDALERTNALLAEQACLALEDRYTTDSGPKQCRWCPLALSSRACNCPSLQAEMKANLTPEILQAIKDGPTDAQLGDFVISGRTLAKPVEQATELLHERIAAQGYVDTASGRRITRKIVKGDISIPEKTKFREAVEAVLPERERQDRCVSWSKGSLIDEIAEARGIHKESKKEASAKDVWEEKLAPLVVQGERKMLVIV